jgi:aspartate kinase
VTRSDKGTAAERLPIIVQKYGGSSLAQPEQIKAAAQNIVQLKTSGKDVLVVVSAMGKSTDQLVELAYQISPAPNRRELDMLLSTGERVSIALMSMALNDAGCRAISFTGSQAGILTDEAHSSARIVDVKPIRVEEELKNGRTPVLAGFQGVSPRTKEITTLGRGGSDTTAVALAAYFKAECCEIRKDVDGVYTADPHVIKEAKHLPHLNYLQLLDMTYWGAKVLHYRSLELANLLKIPITISLAHGEGKQTLIDGDAPMYEQAQILSVNTHKDVRWLKVHASSFTQALEKLCSTLRENGLPWPQILDSHASAKNEWALLITGPLEAVQAITGFLKDKKEMHVEPGELSTVSATCQGSYASDLPEKIAHALGKEKIQVEKMIFGAMTLTVVISADLREKAAQAIHLL